MFFRILIASPMDRCGVMLRLTLVRSDVVVFIYAGIAYLKICMNVPIFRANNNSTLILKDICHIFL